MWVKGKNGGSFRSMDHSIKFNMSKNIWDHISHGEERNNLPQGFRRSLWDWFHKDEYYYITNGYDHANDFLITWRKIKEAEINTCRTEQERISNELEEKRKRIKNNGSIFLSIIAIFTFLILAFTVYSIINDVFNDVLLLYLSIFLSVTSSITLFLLLIVTCLSYFQNKRDRLNSKDYYEKALSVMRKELYNIEAEINDLRSAKYTLNAQIPAINPLGDIEDYIFQNIHTIFNYFQLKLGLITPSRNEYNRIINLKIDLSRTRDEISKELPYYSITPSILSGYSYGLHKMLKDNKREKKHITSFQLGNSINDLRYLSFLYNDIPIFAVNTIHFFIPLVDKLVICKADFDILDNKNVSYIKLYDEEIIMLLTSNIISYSCSKDNIKLFLKQIVNGPHIKENMLFDTMRIDLSNGKSHDVRFPSSDLCFYLQDKEHLNLSSIYSEIITLDNNISTALHKKNTWIKNISEKFDDEEGRNKVISDINKTFIDILSWKKRRNLLEISYNKFTKLRIEKNINQDLAKAIKSYLKHNEKKDTNINIEQLINKLMEKIQEKDNSNDIHNITFIERSDILDAMRIIDQLSSNVPNNKIDEEIWG